MGAGLVLGVLDLLFFMADAESGIHVIHWGNAHLEPDRTFNWLYSEQLPVAVQQLE